MCSIMGLLLIVSCQKPSDDLVIEPISFDEHDRFNRIISIDEQQLYIVGGQRWQRGFIYRSNDGGQTWSPINTVNDTSDFFLTDLARLGEQEWMAVGYGGQIIYTDDDWETISFVRHHSWEQLECIHQLNNQSFIIAGGGDHNEGFALANNSREWWHLEPYTWPMSVRVLRQRQNGDILSIGYASVYISDDHLQHHRPLPLTGDIYTDAAFTDNGQIGYICGFNGSITSIDIESETINELVSRAGLRSTVMMWNTIDFFDEFTGIVCGHDGHIWWTSDAGKTWDQYQIPGKPTIQTAVLRSTQEAIIAGDNGFIAKIRRP